MAALTYILTVTGLFIRVHKTENDTGATAYAGDAEFDAERLESERQTIEQMLDCLPEEFKHGNGAHSLAAMQRWKLRHPHWQLIYKNILLLLELGRAIGKVRRQNGSDGEAVFLVHEKSMGMTGEEIEPEPAEVLIAA